MNSSHCRGVADAPVVERAELRGASVKRPQTEELTRKIAIDGRPNFKHGTSCDATFRLFYAKNSKTGTMHTMRSKDLSKIKAEILKHV